MEETLKCASGLRPTLVLRCAPEALLVTPGARCVGKQALKELLSENYGLAGVFLFSVCGLLIIYLATTQAVRPDVRERVISDLHRVAGIATYADRISSNDAIQRWLMPINIQQFDLTQFWVVVP